MAAGLTKAEDEVHPRYAREICPVQAASQRDLWRGFAAPGSTSHCLSRHGAEDLIGNLWGWTADWTQGGVDWQTTDGQEAVAVWGADYGNDSCWSVNGTARQGGSWAYTGGLPGVVSRGGNWLGGAKVGAFARGQRNAPSVYDSSIGYRCCRNR